MIHVAHVTSSLVLNSRIFADLIRRQVMAAPAEFHVTAGARPNKSADVQHYHRPHRENRLRRGSVVTVHHDPRERHFLLPLRRFLPRWREAERVICLNRTQQMLLAEQRVMQTVLIPHGVDRRVLPVPPAPRRYGGGRIRLGLVSKRYRRGIKGEARLEALLDRLDPCRFSVITAGEGRWQEAALARARGFTAECFESPPYRLFGALYQRIDVLLILSDFEGGPACLPEALGVGVPVAACSVGMVPDWLEDGSNGLILSGNANRDAEALASLVEEGRLDRLFAETWRRAPTVPSWETVTARHFDLYRTIAGAGP